MVKPKLSPLKLGIKWTLGDKDQHCYNQLRGRGGGGVITAKETQVSVLWQLIPISPII